MSKISVGIVTYNRKEKVLKAIKSVVTQNVEDVEIIVLDNNSNDGTGQAIREKYPIVKYIRLLENSGCPTGRNYTFANCTGEVWPETRTLKNTCPFNRFFRWEIK